MPTWGTFDANTEEYDAWFDRHPLAYQSELEALRSLLPQSGRRLEVGVGTGRFAAELGVRVGVEPSPAMGIVAKRRGIDVHAAVAEDLPFEDGSFDVVLMVSAVCFFDDVPVAMNEAYRVLDHGGYIVIGLLDPSTSTGSRYMEQMADSTFYAGAAFVTVDKAIDCLTEAGFGGFEVRQTVFVHPDEMIEPERERAGHGEGLFVVIRAMKPGQHSGDGRNVSESTDGGS